MVQFTMLTSILILWAVKLNWLENGNSRPRFWWTILTCIGQADLVYSVQSGFISMSVHARLLVYVGSGYDSCHPD